MDSDGSFMFGEIPDDADGSVEEEPSLRGWISPDDRLWRHPSELADRARAGATRRSSGRELWMQRRGPIAAGTIGAAAVAAAAAVVLALANAPVPDEANNVVQTATDTSLTVPTGMLQAASTLTPSLVELQPEAAGHSAMTGVVLPGGDLIVTSAVAAAGVRRVKVTTYDGRRLLGRVVASDESSGVAVVSTKKHLNPALFADKLLSPGELTLAAFLHEEQSVSTDPKAMMVEATVEDIGYTVPAATGEGLVDVIEAQTPMRASGGVLVDTAGAVIGILNRQESAPSGVIGFYVPAALALDVAEELVSSHHIEHGWIGVVDSDAAHDSGAEIDGVFSGSPAAAAGLERGDVVVAVDGHLVQTHADLEARLYTVPPGHKIDLTVERDGSLIKVPVVPAA